MFSIWVRDKSQQQEFPRVILIHCAVWTIYYKLSLHCWCFSCILKIIVLRIFILSSFPPLTPSELPATSSCFFLPPFPMLKLLVLVSYFYLSIINLVSFWVIVWNSFPHSKKYLFSSIYLKPSFFLISTAESWTVLTTVIISHSYCYILYFSSVIFNSPFECAFKSVFIKLFQTFLEAWILLC